MLEIMLWCSSSYEDNGLVPKGIMFDCSKYDGGKLQYFQEHLKVLKGLILIKKISGVDILTRFIIS